VIFAQMVNDPGYERQLGRGVNKEKAASERERLFKLIEQLVQWENTNNPDVLARVLAEIVAVNFPVMRILIVEV
jgi:putative DNA methylase